MLGIAPKSDGIAITATLPPGIRSMKTLAPLSYGGKRLFFQIVRGAGRRIERFLPYADLASEATIRI